jgi:hypothetical protein
MDLTPEASFTHHASTVWLSFGVLLVALLSVAGGVALSTSRFGSLRLLGGLIGGLGALLLVFSGLSALKYGVAWDEAASGASPTLTILFGAVPFVFLFGVAVMVWNSRRQSAA